MNEQITLADLTGDGRYISPRDLEQKVKKKETLKKAQNKAAAIIDDAKLRYIKEKTKARSKAAANEKDALLSSPRFKKLDLYDRKEDIIEAYGYDCITLKEADELEALWDEREKIRSKVADDGFYKDEVTEILFQAYILAIDYFEDEIQKIESLQKRLEK